MAKDVRIETVEVLKSVGSVQRRRRFTEVEKSEILADAQTRGVAAAARHYGVAPSLIYIWRRKESEPGNGENVPSAFVRATPRRIPRNQDCVRVNLGNTMVVEIPVGLGLQGVAGLIRNLGGMP